MPAVAWFPSVLLPPPLVAQSLELPTDERRREAPVPAADASHVFRGSERQRRRRAMVSPPNSSTSRARVCGTRPAAAVAAGAFGAAGSAASSPSTIATAPPSLSSDLAMTGESVAQRTERMRVRPSMTLTLPASRSVVGWDSGAAAASEPAACATTAESAASPRVREERAIFAAPAAPPPVRPLRLRRKPASSSSLPSASSASAASSPPSPSPAPAAVEGPAAAAAARRASRLRIALMRAACTGRSERLRRKVSAQSSSCHRLLSARGWSWRAAPPEACDARVP